MCSPFLYSKTQMDKAAVTVALADTRKELEELEKYKAQLLERIGRGKSALSNARKELERRKWLFEKAMKLFIDCSKEKAVLREELEALRGKVRQYSAYVKSSPFNFTLGDLMTYAKWWKDNQKTIENNVSCRDFTGIKMDFEACWHDGYKQGRHRSDCGHVFKYPDCPNCKGVAEKPAA